MRVNPILAAAGNHPIAAFQQQVHQRRLAGLGVIDFSIGDPSEPTPPFIAEALRAAVPEVSQYPLTGGLPELRKAVADYVQRRFGVEVDPDTQVMPTSGSKEAIFSTALAFIDRDSGDIVAYPSPGYPIYERGARLAGARAHPVVLDGDFVLRASSISDEAWAGLRLLWSCSPHNPTGAVTTLDDLEELYERCGGVGALLLSDECYADIFEPEAWPGGPPSALEVAAGDLSGVLVYLSCSKRSGMTGYRSGAIVGDADAIAALYTLRTATGTASPDFVQRAAIAAWSDDSHAEQRRKIFSTKRAILRRTFAELGGYDIVASEAGLYLWVAVGDDVTVSERLLEEGVIVAPGRVFGRGGEGFLRLALVPTIEECEEAVGVIQRCLR